VAGTVALADVPDPAADLPGFGDDVVPGDLGAAGRRRDQGGQHPDRGGLAGAVRSEHGDQFAGLDVEADAPDRVHGLVAAHREVLAERSGSNHDFLLRS
jgi:hypothetical protein